MAVRARNGPGAFEKQAPALTTIDSRLLAPRSNPRLRLQRANQFASGQLGFLKTLSPIYSVVCSALLDFVLKTLPRVNKGVYFIVIAHFIYGKRNLNNNFATSGYMI